MKAIRIKGDNWTDQDIGLFLDDYNAGMETREMAKKYAVAHNSVKVLAHQFGANYRNVPLQDEERLWLKKNSKKYSGSVTLCRAMNKALGTNRNETSFNKILISHCIPYNSGQNNALQDFEREWLMINSMKYSGSIMIARAMNNALGTSRREDCFGRILKRNNIPYKVGGRFVRRSLINS